MPVDTNSAGFDLTMPKGTETQRNLVWCDLETTGLPVLSEGHLFNHQILEIAVVVTDQQLHVIDKMSLVIHVDIKVARALSDDIVWKMHSDNGLYQASSLSTISRKTAEEMVLEFLVKNGVEKGRSPLCGSSIYMDRMFIEAKMPRLNAFLHYRNIDVSSIKEMMADFGQSYDHGKKSSHRAMDDILHSIGQARQYRSVLKAGVAFLGESY